MSEAIKLILTDKIDRNPENPRLIFHEDELESLLDSISENGILVPLAVYREGKRFVLLDGERRWRCATKLGLSDVPAIVQPKPGTMQNLMMMFAIHNARRDWDPLPTAIKLEALGNEFRKRNGREPKEVELAGIASMKRGEVRRLKKLLSIPKAYRRELMKELKKPRKLQDITVDQVLESFKGAEALGKKEVITKDQEEKLIRSLVDKFREGLIQSTVDPRLLVKIGRAVERGDIELAVVKVAIKKLISSGRYSIQDAFNDTVASADFEHSTEQLADRLIARIEEQQQLGFKKSKSFRKAIRSLIEFLEKQV